MTEEEIKNLKPGDILTVECTVISLVEHIITTNYTNAPSKSGERWYRYGDFMKAATLAKPAPTFEVGDTVRIIPDPLSREVYGDGLGKANLEDEVVEIIHSLKAGDIQVETKEGEKEWVSIHCLALVKKAVKDKYYVKDLPLAYGINLAEYPDNPSIATFNKHSHPNAAPAAKAECARLNAEWRKSQAPT